MESLVLQLGVGGIFTVLVLKLVFDFLKTKNSPQPTNKMYDRVKQVDIKTTNINEKINELHKWHDHEDDEGVKVWYIRKSLEKTIEMLADATNNQSELISSQTQILVQLVKELKEKTC